MDNILKYLVNKKVVNENAKINKLNKGGSGANLFEINCSGGDYILKHYDTEAILKLGEKEYTFYNISNNFDLKYLPEVIFTEKHEDMGIIIVLKKYKDIDVAEWDLARQQTAADIIAQIHSKSDFFIKQLNIKNEPFVPPLTEELKKAYADWDSVLNKHNINRAIFEDINKHFSYVIDFMRTHRNTFLHGDFFPDNCEVDKNNEMLLIDWQNCQLGSKAEIAFFIIIGHDWGINIYENEIKKHYCERLSYYTGNSISTFELDMECNMTTIFVTYLHWANYLQDSGIERVKAIFGKMIDSYEWLRANNCF